MNCRRHTVTVFLDIFLRDRSFSFFVEEALSTPRSTRAEVPQGSCLLPCLFAAFTDDISTLRHHLEEQEDDVMLALYADDSTYFASSCRADIAARKVQQVFELLLKWLDRWRTAVNVGKTATLLNDR
ncbi:Probable RNA-directed DNA polymerase from transposon BS [Eumeta japonica]|uniref:Probable RNA-directed DNA polymerase from transposon BS n=1 Tax=Eumeta variegata TaxID=151549 RepID=A0A4C1TQH9_EUMVA|nr:Probable RNA-directed DNA polymerase from transposon BS [Eumeta japonica]